MSTTPINPETVVVVDDDKNFCALVERWLKSEKYRVATFTSGQACLDKLDRMLPVCVCLDLNLPDADGLEILSKLKKLHRHLPVIILTGDTAVDRAVKAIQKGAYDYLVKPADRSRLLNTVKNAVEKYRFSLRVSQLERKSTKRNFGGLIGASTAMQDLFAEMEKVAASDISVLIKGESGTGKELIAKAIHDNSGRSSSPFVALNCAAVPESLQESELFGHEKGSFTGATARRKGKFELADNGTLFLDEVAELSAGLQAKLLRVLQEKTFTRVGGSQEQHSDFRLVAASHRNLAHEMAEGRFREDLYYRIAVYELDIPPLREREGDIELLARHFFTKYGKPLHGFTAGALDLLRSHPFRGNVRELENYVQRALVSAEGTSVTEDALPQKLFDTSAEKLNKQEAASPDEREVAEAAPFASLPEGSLEDIEKLAIEAAVKRHSGNLSKVTRELGIGRTTLYRKIEKYGLKPGDD